MTTYHLAEHIRARNWYAGTSARYPLTSLISQARKTKDFETCRKWCEKNPDYRPKEVEIEE